MSDKQAEASISNRILVSVAETWLVIQGNADRGAFKGHPEGVVSGGIEAGIRQGRIDDPAFLHCIVANEDLLCFQGKGDELEVVRPRVIEYEAALCGGCHSARELNIGGRSHLQVEQTDRAVPAGGRAVVTNFSTIPNRGGAYKCLLTIASFLLSSPEDFLSHCS